MCRLSGSPKRWLQQSGTTPESLVTCGLSGHGNGACLSSSAGRRRKGERTITPLCLVEKADCSLPSNWGGIHFHVSSRSRFCRTPAFTLLEALSNKKNTIWWVQFLYECESLFRMRKGIKTNYWRLRFPSLFSEIFKQFSRNVSWWQAASSLQLPDYNSQQPPVLPGTHASEGPWNLSFTDLTINPSSFLLPYKAKC